MPQTTRRLTAGLPTMALGMGAAGHRLETKLRAMSEAGFKAVEVRVLRFARGDGRERE